MKILYSISPIGLGHATRSVAIALKLRKLGYNITFGSSAKVCGFLGSYGFECMVVHRRVPYFSISRDGVLKNTLLWMIKYIRFYKRMKKIARRLIVDWDLIISDEEFAFGNEALEINKPLIFVSDLLTTNFARNFIARAIENRTNAWFIKFFKRVPLVIALEDNFPDYPNIRKITPIARETNRSREEIRYDLGIPRDKKLVLISAGGGDAGDFIYRYALNAISDIYSEELFTIIVGETKYCAEARGNIKCYDFYRDLHELIYASDLVITTAGKSTIDECLVYGTPFIAIPIKNHYEQERNARKFGYNYSDIYRLRELIIDKINSGRLRTVRNRIGDAVKEIVNYIEEHS